ncbi:MULTISPECIES: hypothetical protein [Roseiflexus]|jgi:hypothetical protein|uniref:Uncharacterized protein n=1 Tax=Roseiflexus castenholzii (strain DSM 13941 / HLO8) TaxID=383372 RepID=A7NP26_ROSCS|nr:MULTISPECIES: hypothetical protein [Roseiflexus]ABU59322.1 hypothetical protein Rcas_3270 [Roseiflexus castenholzii DSM 13941]
MRRRKLTRTLSRNATIDHRATRIVSSAVALIHAYHAIDSALFGNAWNLAVIFWLPYSFLLSLVIARAIYLELRRTEQRWNKPDRVGIGASVVASPQDRATQRRETLPHAQTMTLLPTKNRRRGWRMPGIWRYVSRHR